ncbi:MAG: FkbM family methyltransferase, partial [Candidatus Obscuribacterales bacterium]|nr:FkbM family methyltransferase [Candidatus Obscuribacterales bacterium]
MQFNKKALLPIEYPDLIRLGKHNDGGYVVPKSAIDNVNLLLTFGVANDWSFEQDFRKLNPTARIDAYDHTIGESIYSDIKYSSLVGSVVSLGMFKPKEALEQLNKSSDYVDHKKRYREFFNTENNAFHYQLRIARRGDEYSISPYELFNHLLAENPDVSIFLKIDIEGAEYEVMEQILTFSKSIKAIAIECHECDRKRDFDKMINSMKKEFSIVHIHANNYGPVNEYHDFPAYLEITLVNNSCLVESASIDRFSTKTYP